MQVSVALLRNDGWTASRSELRPHLKKVRHTVLCTEIKRWGSTSGNLYPLAAPIALSMASYDSDSSLDGQTEYTETGVLLGYASQEATEDAISHLGGIPVPNVSPYQLTIATDLYMCRHG